MFANGEGNQMWLNLPHQKWDFGANPFVPQQTHMPKWPFHWSFSFRALGSWSWRCWWIAIHHYSSVCSPFGHMPGGMCLVAMVGVLEVLTDGSNSIKSGFITSSSWLVRSKSGRVQRFAGKVMGGFYYSPLKNPILKEKNIYAFSFVLWKFWLEKKKKSFLQSFFKNLFWNALFS